MNEKISVGLAIIALLVSIVAISSAVFIKPEAEIGVDSIGSRELQADSVSSSNIANGTITDEDIDDRGISKIANGAITMDDLSSVVTTAITGTAEIAKYSITSENIANETITTGNLANDSVTSEKIADGAVNSSDIATDAVGSEEIANNSIGTLEIENDAVTYNDMAIKIKCGLAEDVVHGTTLYHTLPGTPTSVVVTPVYNRNLEGGTVVIHANVYNVTSNSFDIALWFEIEYPWPNTPIRLEKVDGGAGDPVQSVDVYWIAIYDSS